MSRRDISNVGTSGSVFIGSVSETLLSYVRGKTVLSGLLFFVARRYTSTMCEVSRFFNNEFGQDSNIVV